MDQLQSITPLEKDLKEAADSGMYTLAADMQFSIINQLEDFLEGSTWHEAICECVTNRHK